MHRKAIVLSLGLALVFAALPGISAFSFAGADPPDSDSTRVPVTVVDSPLTGHHSLAMGIDKHPDCPFGEPGIDSSRF